MDLLFSLLVDLPVKMAVDDHLVSLITPPWNVILVPQVKRVTVELNPLTRSHLVVNNTANPYGVR